MREAMKKLEGELRTLEHELRIELPKEIQKAVAMGDLRENAEYAAALERQAFVKARIGQLRLRLGELGAMNLDSVPRDKVAIGSRIKLLDLDKDEEVTYELVIPEIADLDRGLISVASPIGQGLMGHREGDEVICKIPSGERNFEILELETMHDRDNRD